MDFSFRYRLALLVLCIALLVPAGVVAAATHTVSRGESLYKISSWYKTSVSAIKSANGLKSNYVYPGQRLYIPAAKNVTAQAAPTVSRGVSYVSRSDFDLLARIITAEADSESYTTKVAVGAVILNRVESPLFPDTIPGVVYQVAYGRYQFEPVLNGWINRPASAESIRAAKDALNGWDPTGGALYFFESWVPNKYLQSKKISIVLDSFVFSY
ncbi:cell wall hydrolase [Desulfolucanica intricata]|uniref:cell wall hydrolase n=1 Tax=Desulfolucanica intricata TaxID=1285191 RepID=UPI00082C1CF5|nr:cell wall hydrolase [Desulfolucanica intricata]